MARVVATSWSLKKSIPTLPTAVVSAVAAVMPAAPSGPNMVLILPTAVPTPPTAELARSNPALKVAVDAAIGSNPPLARLTKALVHSLLICADVDSRLFANSPTVAVLT